MSEDVSAHNAVHTAKSADLSILATFLEGPLGISLGDNRIIGAITAGSAAETNGVLPGDRLTHVGDVDVSVLHYEDILSLIRVSSRPLKLAFLRPAGGNSLTQTTETSASTRAQVPTTGQAKSAVLKAGAFMKGLLSTSVQIVQAVDKAIDRAIDDSSKVRLLTSLQGMFHHSNNINSAASRACRPYNRS
jgi:hypothetical protein